MLIDPVKYPALAARINEVRAKRDKRNKRARENRKLREDLLRSCGLTKVRGNLGGTYWE